MTGKASSVSANGAQGLDSARQAPRSHAVGEAHSAAAASAPPAGGSSQLSDWDACIAPALASLRSAAETLSSDVRALLLLRLSQCRAGQMLADSLLKRVHELQVNKCTQIVVDAFAVRLLCLSRSLETTYSHLQAALLPQICGLYLIPAVLLNICLATCHR